MGGRAGRLPASPGGFRTSALAEALICDGTPGICTGALRGCTLSPPSTILLSASLSLGIRIEPAKLDAVADCMCLPSDGFLELFPGARDLLSFVRQSDSRCAALSNVAWRSARVYWRDFAAFGVADRFDAVITSIEVGHPKPHRACSTPPYQLSRCIQRRVMVGNTERNDITAAASLGMGTILAAIERPAPEVTGADAVVTSLDQVADLLAPWI